MQQLKPSDKCDYLPSYQSMKLFKNIKGIHVDETRLLVGHIPYVIIDKF